MTSRSRAAQLTRALIAGGVIAAIAVAISIQWIDVPLARFLSTYRDTTWVRFFAFITNFANGAIWYTLAVLEIGAAWALWRRAPERMPRQKLTHHVRAWFFMIVAMATSGIFLNIVKVAVGRDRPRVLFRGDVTALHPFSMNIDASSFPSGHTQSICAAMLSLSFLYPPLRPLFALIAVLIAASRVIITAHYLSDVIAGAYIGIAAVLLWRVWFERTGIAVTLMPSKGRLSAPAAAPSPPATSN